MVTFLYAGSRWTFGWVAATVVTHKQQSYKEALNISLGAQTNCIDLDSRCNALIAHVEPFSRPLKHMRVHSPRDSSAVSPLAVDLTLTTWLPRFFTVCVVRQTWLRSKTSKSLFQMLYPWLFWSFNECMKPLHFEGHRVRYQLMTHTWIIFFGSMIIFSSVPFCGQINFHCIWYVRILTNMWKSAK